MYFGYYRLSEDLDFDIVNKDITEIINKIRDLISGMNLKISDEIMSMRNWNANIVFEGMYKNNVKIDISYTERPMLSPVKNPVKHLYPDVGLFYFKCFQLKEIMSEKIRAIITRKEPRDYFDIWYILKKEPRILENIMDLADKKCKFLNAEADLSKAFEGMNVLEKLWKYRLEPVVPNLPKFETVISELREKLK